MPKPSTRPPLPSTRRTGLATLPLLTMLALLLAALPVSNAAAQAPEAAGSEATARLTRMVDALGGRAGYARSLNAEVSSEVKTVAARPGLVVRATVTTQTRDDGALRIERDTQGQVHRIGSDTHSYWQQGRDGKVTQLSPDEKSALEMEKLRRHLPVHHVALGYEITSSNDGEPTLTFRRKGTKPTDRAPGDRFVFTLDRRTNLPKLITFDRKDPFGKSAVAHSVQLEDYRTVSGVAIPHKTTLLRAGKATHEATITKISIGKRLPDAQFMAPSATEPRKRD